MPPSPARPIVKGVQVHIGTREALLADLAAALAPGEPTRALVVLRVEGYDEFTAHFGFGATEALIDQVMGCLPDTIGPLAFYYRPRENELCALVAGRLERIEGALFATANAVFDLLGMKGVSLDFGLAVLPHEVDDPVAALALADGRMTVWPPPRRRGPRFPPRPARGTCRRLSEQTRVGSAAGSALSNRGYVGACRSSCICSMPMLGQCTN